MGYSKSFQRQTLPEDLPADVRKALEKMDFEGRLEAARARRKIVLAQKKAARSDESTKHEQTTAETPAPPARFAEESARQPALVRARPVIGGLSAAAGVFASFAVIAERMNVMPPLQILSASVAPQVQAESPTAIAGPSVSLFAAASGAASISRQAVREVGLPAAELRLSSPLPPGPEVAWAEAATLTVADAPSRIAALSTPVQRSDAGAPQIDSPTLPGTFAAPPRAVPATLVSASLTEPPKPGDPAPALRAARPMDLRIFVPNLAPVGTMQNVQDRIERSGFAATKASDVPYSISRTQVRYYQPAYREQAEALAEALGARARDFTDRLGTATEGVVELWLAGDGAAPASPMRASASRNVVRSGTVAASGPEVRVVRTTRTRPNGGGLGSFLGAMIGGIRDTPAPGSGDAGPVTVEPRATNSPPRTSGSVTSPSTEPSGGSSATDDGGSSSKGNRGNGNGNGNGNGGGNGNGNGGGNGGRGKN